VPTRAHPRNPHRVGHVVTCIKWNATGEGILWAVTKVKGAQVRIEPLLTLTGPSVLKPKWVDYDECRAADILQLGSAYAQLGNLIQDIVRYRSG
jgi:hypothetical protein